jgi:phage virion morphogenesis protein
MTAPIEFTLHSQELHTALDAIARTGRIDKLMPAIAAELLAQTEDNFRAQGQPRWASLSARTIAERTKKGSWPGKILQVSGALARSVIADSGPAYAAIGVAGDAHPYAAIQQLGGTAGKNHSVTIQARPYLPMDANGNLSPEAEHGVLTVCYAFLQKAVIG